MIILFTCESLKSMIKIRNENLTVLPQFGPGINIILAKNNELLYNVCHKIWTGIAVQYWLSNDSESEYVDYRFGNDYHHVYIRAKMDEMEKSKAQYVLGTMNPSVIDCMEFESKSDAMSRIHIVTESYDVVNMSESQGESFICSYNSGYQHVSEILRVNGIW